MGTIKADTVTGLADPNKATIPNTITMGSTTATLNFGNTVVANASAGSTTITGEGGSTTTNLQQGLCKTWCDYNAASDGDGTMSLADSFNIASLTDNGTGDYTFAHTNDMASGNYVFLGGSQYETGAIASVTTLRIKSGSAGNKAAATMRIQSEYSNTSGNSTAYDYAQQQFAVHGDLA